jgi:hypothetical protein
VLLTNKNKIYIYGNNIFYELKNSENIPKKIKMNKKITKIASGISHIIFITNEPINNIYGFGSNNQHQLCSNNTSTINEHINLITNNEKIEYIEAGDNSTFFLLNKPTNNLYVIGKIGSISYKNYHNIQFEKKIIMMIYTEELLFFITNERSYNTYLFKNGEIIQQQLPCKVKIIKKVNDSILSKTTNNTRIYCGKDCVIYSGKKQKFDIDLLPNFNVPKKNEIDGLNCENINYIIYNTLSINNKIEINKTLNIHNEYHEYVYLFTPSGTIFDDYVSFNTNIQYDKFQHILFKTDENEYELKMIDDGVGTYYIVDENNIIKIFTLHFSSLIIKKILTTTVELDNKQYFFTKKESVININIKSNYEETYTIILKNPKNNNIQDTFYINSMIETHKNIYCDIISNTRNYTTTVNANIYFINDINISNLLLNVKQVKKIKINTTTKLNFTYNTENIKITQNNNNLQLHGLKKGRYNIIYSTPLYEKNFYINIIPIKPKPIIIIKKKKKRDDIYTIIPFQIKNFNGKYKIKIGRKNKKYVKIRNNNIYIQSIEKITKKIKLKFICDKDVIKKYINHKKYI